MSVAAVAASAANRTVTINAPASVFAGDKITITVAARTEAGGGERIGFMHADYSTDGGATWTGITYSTNEKTSASRSATFKAGAAGSTAMVRLRVAFRGGKAGDVDYMGKPIAWETSWAKWQEPPAKLASIAIQAK